MQLQDPSPALTGTSTLLLRHTRNRTRPPLLRRTRFTPAKPSWPSQAKATSQKAKVSDRPQAAASCGGLASRLRSHPGNGTGPRAAKRPRRSRGASGTRRPVPLVHLASRLRSHPGFRRLRRPVKKPRFSTGRGPPHPAANRPSRFTPAKPSWPSQAKAAGQKAKVFDRPQTAASCGGQAVSLHACEAILAFAG